MMIHRLAVVAVADADPIEGQRSSKLVDLVCSCGRTYRVRDEGDPRVAKGFHTTTCLDPMNMNYAIFAIQRSDVRVGHVLNLGARDVDGEPLEPGDYVEQVFGDRQVIGYVDRFSGPNQLRIEKVVVFVYKAGMGVLGAAEGSGRAWRKLDSYDSRVLLAHEALLESRVHTSQPLRRPTPQEPASYWWAFWRLAPDAADSFGSSVDWPPPSPIVAYWPSEKAVGAPVDLTFLCRGETPAKVRAIIQQWAPALGPEQLIVPCSIDIDPPSGYANPPTWSLELNRWPWRRVQGA